MLQLSLFDPAPPPLPTGPNAPLSQAELVALAHIGIHVQPGGHEEGRGYWYRVKGAYWPELGSDDLRMELEYAALGAL